MSLQIYRNFEIGKLIKLIMLDTRVIGAHMVRKSPENLSVVADDDHIMGSMYT